MQITKDKQNNILILRLGADIKSGKATGEIELDIDNNYIYTEEVEKAIGIGEVKLLIDLSNISYIDSSGLGAIFDSYKLVSDKNGSIILLNPSTDVKRVLDITQISKKIKVVVDENEALESF